MICTAPAQGKCVVQDGAQPLTSELRAVAVLFCREASVYKTFAGVDCWDRKRNTMQWPGGSPLVAHPPCRLWSKLRKLSTAPEGEKECARFALAAVRKWGGVLEHPAQSSLWSECNLPRPGAGADTFGGYSIGVPQKWFGHRSEKDTWLYIVGVRPRELPTVPLTLAKAERTVESLPKWERDATPEAFAHWLIDLARRVRR